MTEVEEQQQVVQQRVDTPPAGGYASASPAVDASSATTTRRSSVTQRVSGNETARRVMILLFGIVQAVILLRFTFLLLDAREGNGIVSGILSFSQLFVSPFEGIFKTDALHSAGSILEFASLAALVGWTILEALALAILGIVTRKPQGAGF